MSKYINYMFTGWLILLGVMLVGLVVGAVVSFVTAKGANAVFAILVVLVLFGFAPVLGYLVTDWAVETADDIKDSMYG